MDGFAYVDNARPGELNMAIDRELLETAEREQCAWVRLYRWSEPTLSLGRFQATLDRGIHAPSSQLPSVLRASGGGAIVHHHEWTYSLAVPVGRNQVGAATHLYDIVHDALVEGLRGLGWDAAKWISECSAASQVSASPLPGEAAVGCSSVAATGGAPPFLCFRRRSCGDIVCGDFKIVGSAQRRHGSSVLQHGSILFARSQFAPELPGLCELPRGGPLSNTGASIATRIQSEYSSKEHFETLHFAELVLEWLTAALEADLGIAFERLPAPPEHLAGLDEQAKA